jgi:hypothetical protein
LQWCVVNDKRRCLLIAFADGKERDSPMKGGERCNARSLPSSFRSATPKGQKRQRQTIAVTRAYLMATSSQLRGRTMMISTSKHPPIEFSGSVAELATTLGLPVSELRASIAGLIERGYLAPIGGGVWRLYPRPAR